MLVPITPLSETRAYKEIFAEGKLEGKLEGEIESLNSLLAEGLIGKSVHDARTKTLYARLKALQAEQED